MSDISVVMGSKSDWPAVRETYAALDQLGVAYEKKMISAHRMPNEMFAFAQNAADNGVKVVVACTGGAAHPPGMTATNIPLPVIGVPRQTKALGGMDSLLSVVQMPAGIPVATTATGKAGAKDVVSLALQILGTTDKHIQQQIIEYRQAMYDQAKESRQYPE